MAKAEEQALVKKLLHGDSQALHAIYKTYNAPLFRFVYKRITNKQIAEELTQDIIIQFLESVRDFRFESSIKTYLFSIARYKMIDYMRKKKVKRILFSHMPAFIVEGLSTVVMEDELEKKELQEKLEQTFHELPDDYAVVLRLKYMEQQSVEQIARTLVRTFKSTESLLFRARQAFIKIYSNLP